MDYDKVKVSELVKKISGVLEGSEMKNSASALAVCVSFCIDAAGPSEEGKTIARGYINNVIDHTLKQAERGRGKWGQLLIKLTNAG